MRVVFKIGDAVELQLNDGCRTFTLHELAFVPSVGDRVVVAQTGEKGTVTHRLVDYCAGTITIYVQT